MLIGTEPAWTDSDPKPFAPYLGTGWGGGGGGGLGVPHSVIVVILQ